MMAQPVKQSTDKPANKKCQSPYLWRFRDVCKVLTVLLGEEHKGRLSSNRAIRHNAAADLAVVCCRHTCGHCCQLSSRVACQQSFGQLLRWECGSTLGVISFLWGAWRAWRRRLAGIVCEGRCAPPG